jgi:hypothetical protein
LNGLTPTSVIFPGDELIIKLAEATPTPTLTRLLTTATATPKASATVRPTRTPSVDTATPEVEAVALAGATQNDPGDGRESSTFFELPSGVDPVLVIIGVLLMVGSGLVLFGALAKRNP